MAYQHLGFHTAVDHVLVRDVTLPKNKSCHVSFLSYTILIWTFCQVINLGQWMSEVIGLGYNCL